MTEFKYLPTLVRSDGPYALLIIATWAGMTRSHEQHLFSLSTFFQ